MHYLVLIPLLVGYTLFLFIGFRRLTFARVPQILAISGIFFSAVTLLFWPTWKTGFEAVIIVDNPKILEQWSSQSSPINQQNYQNEQNRQAANVANDGFSMQALMEHLQKQGLLRYQIVLAQPDSAEDFTKAGVTEKDDKSGSKPSNQDASVQKNQEPSSQKKSVLRPFCRPPARPSRDRMLCASSMEEAFDFACQQWALQGTWDKTIYFILCRQKKVIFVESSQPWKSSIDVATCAQKALQLSILVDVLHTRIHDDTASLEIDLHCRQMMAN